MIRQDFIMKMIEQLVKVLAKILFNKETGDFQAAEKEIEFAFRNITGLDYFLLNTLSDKDIITLLNFSKDNTSAGIKCLIIAKLFKEKAELPKNDKLFESDPGDEYLKSLILFLEGINNTKDCGIDLTDFHNDIKDLTSKIDIDRLPKEARIRLSNYIEIFGNR